MWTDEHYIFVKNSEMYQILTEAQLEGSVMLLTISRSKHLLNFLSKKKMGLFLQTHTVLQAVSNSIRKFP